MEVTDLQGVKIQRFLGSLLLAALQRASHTTTEGTIPARNYLSHEDAPEEVAKLIDEFLQKT